MTTARIFIIVDNLIKEVDIVIDEAERTHNIVILKEILHETLPPNLRRRKTPQSVLPRTNWTLSSKNEERWCPKQN
jgi:hypothetical protein